MTNEKWNFPEGNEMSGNTDFVALPNERMICTLVSIKECTINYKQWGPKQAIRINFTPTAEAMAEHGIELKDDQVANISTIANLARSAKSRMWQTLKSMAEPSDLEKIDPMDGEAMQAAYMDMIGRQFEVIVEHNNGFNNAMTILRIKGAKEAQAKKKVSVEEASKTGFEDMPDQSTLGSKLNDVSFDDDDLPF